MKGNFIKMKQDNRYHLAVDIGASSGRHILGYIEDGKLILKEIYRFENHLVQRHNHLCWDVDELFEQIKKGMHECAKQGYSPKTMGIDTWGVDFVLLDEHGKRISDAVSYRDLRTTGIIDQVEKIVPFAEHYLHTGIQYQPFNTVYQLLAIQKEQPSLLDQAQTLLMMPDYFQYRLTGNIAQEYTNATTTALVDASTKNWDFDLIERLHLPKRIFQKITSSGTVLGKLTDEIKEETGLDVEVILPASHDTGSAFIAVPTKDEHSVFISSGTWSLLGVENSVPITTDKSMRLNFTNEGGYQYCFRYLKNIMGLWMLQQIRRELKDAGNTYQFIELIELAKQAKDFRAIVDVNDTRFLAPKSMLDEVVTACKDTGQAIPSTVGEVLQVVYQSLAYCYKQAIHQLEKITERKFTCINIVGGGCQDMYLHQLTADVTGLTVYAGPIEGTALGNILVQMITSKEIKDIAEARKFIRNSFEIKEIKPR